MTYLKYSLKHAFVNRNLLWQMILSKLIVGQKTMMLGYLWWILEPMLFMLVYWILVGVIFNRGGENYPLFVLCGLVPYRAFAISFSQSVGSISGKFSLLSQLNFPRIYLPFTDILVNHIKLIFGFLVVVVFSMFFGIHLQVKLIYLAIPFIAQILFVAGLSLIVSIGGVYFRDLKNLMLVINRIFLYLSPVLYPIESIPEKFRGIYRLNPIACWVESYRHIIMKNQLPPLDLTIIGLTESFIILAVGYTLFSFQEKRILKYV